MQLALLQARDQGSCQNTRPLLVHISIKTHV